MEKGGRLVATMILRVLQRSLAAKMPLRRSASRGSRRISVKLADCLARIRKVMFRVSISVVMVRQLVNLKNVYPNARIYIALLTVLGMPAPKLYWFENARIHVKNPSHTRGWAPSILWEG